MIAKTRANRKREKEILARTGIPITVLGSYTINWKRGDFETFTVAGSYAVNPEHPQPAPAFYPAVIPEAVIEIPILHERRDSLPGESRQ
jgi:hypothetical protein